MRHRKSNLKLGRTASHRNAMMRNMVTSLFECERITTTLVKAKALRSLADKVVTLAKRGDLHASRLAETILTKKDVVGKLFKEAQERYMDRPSGYTTLVKVAPRKGDAAPMAVLELIKPGQIKVAAKPASAKADREKRKAASQKTVAETSSGASE